MARYELVEGKSAKFWDAEVSGRDLTVRYGRIGAAGQTQTKTFADEAAATKEHTKLVREKTSKGYVLVATTGVNAETPPTGDTTAAPSAKPSKAPKKAEAAAVTLAGFVPVGDGHDGYLVALEGGKVVCAKNGARLASVPKQLKETSAVERLVAVSEWLTGHDERCVTTVETWMLRSLPTPRTLLEAVWVDASFRRALENLVVVPLSPDARPIGEPGFFKGISDKGVGLVDADGETNWSRAESIGIPHPIMLDALDDLRALASELALTTTVSQLFRETYTLAGDVPATETAVTTYAGGTFAQLSHAATRCRKLGYRLSGGSAVVRTFERGRMLEARYWVGADDPMGEAFTGDLVFVDKHDVSVPLREVTPIAYSEGVRMAASIYAGRKTEEATTHA